MLIAGLTLGYLFIYFGAKDTAYEQYKAQNNCPYEGLECPNAQLVDSIARLEYNDAEYVIDSLFARTQQLETQLAGCEFQDHSRLVAH